MVQFVRKGSTRSDISTRSLETRANTANDETMTIDAILSTETAARMMDWYNWEEMDEILLAEGRSKLPHVVMLDTHDRSSINKILGHMANVRTEGTDTIVTCTFDQDDPEAVKAYRKYRNGHARALSVGYSVMKFTDIPPGQSETVNGRSYTAQKNRKMRIVTKWRVDEGSLVPIGADKNALARNGARGASFEIEDGEAEKLLAMREQDSRKVQRRRKQRQDKSVEVTETTEAETTPEIVQGELLQVERSPQVIINITNGEVVTEKRDEVQVVTETVAPVEDKSPELETRNEEDATSVVADVTLLPAESGGATERKGLAMSDTTSPADTTEQDKVQIENARKAAREEGIRAERERQAQIRKEAGSDVSKEVLDKCLEDADCTVERAIQLFLQDIRTNRATPVKNDAPNIITSNRRERDCTVDVLTTALALRVGGERVARALPFVTFNERTGKMTMKPITELTDERRKAIEDNMNKAERMENYSQIRLCREQLRNRGIDDFDEDDFEEIAQRSFSTPGVTTIYTQTVGAVLLANLMDIQDSTQGWCNVMQVPDFKKKELHRLEGGALTRRVRGKEAAESEFADTMETFSVHEYANKMKIDRQDLIDDSLQAWNTVGQNWAYAVGDLRPSLVYGALAANAALTDTIALFHADHGNLTTSAALSHETLQTSMNRLAAMKGANGNILGLRDAYLVVPQTLYYDAKKILNATEVRSNESGIKQYGTVNILNGEPITLAADVRLSSGFTYPYNKAVVAGAPTTWYLMSKGGRYGVVVGYLAGTNGMPTMRTKALDGGSYGIQMDMNLDIGVGFESYQGVGKHTA